MLRSEQQLPALREGASACRVKVYRVHGHFYVTCPLRLLTDVRIGPRCCPVQNMDDLAVAHEFMMHPETSLISELWTATKI